MRRIRRSSLTTSGWREEVWAEWSGGTPPSAADTTALFLADLDNNGAVDLIGSTPGGSAVWLAGADYALTALDLGPSRAIRVLETASPPTFYVPPGDVQLPLERAPGTTWCEWKGQARYWTIVALLMKSSAGKSRVR